MISIIIPNVRDIVDRIGLISTSHSDICPKVIAVTANIVSSVYVNWLLCSVILAILIYAKYKDNSLVLLVTNPAKTFPPALFQSSQLASIVAAGFLPTIERKTELPLNAPIPML